MDDVLVVDDDPALRRLYGIWLEARGFAVRDAADGIEALVSLVASGLPAAAVVDITMPRLDGLELCRILRRIAPGVAVVIVSARDDAPSLGSAAGADVVLGKPSNPAELVDGLRHLLDERAAA